MNKKLFIFMTILCQLLFYGKNITTSSVFVDTAVEDLCLTNTITSQKSFHLFSHGRSGELFIDNQWLNVEAIANKFRNKLNGKTELYVYGCNFAEGVKGKAAVQYLEQTLKISVSASTNITGADGDWILEVGHGKNALELKEYRFNFQLDKKHYLNPIISSTYGAQIGLGYEHIYLSTPSVTNITVQVNFGDDVSSPRIEVRNLTTNTRSTVTNGSVTFNNANPVKLRFINGSNGLRTAGTTALTRPSNSAGIKNTGASTGVILTSSENFYVNYRVNSGDQAGSLMAKGKAALGKEFYWGGSPIEYNSNRFSSIGNMISIMATENGITTITLSDVKPGTKFNIGNTEVVPQSSFFTQDLAKGESFVYFVQGGASPTQWDGWLGAKLEATKNVSVVVGGMLQQGASGDSRDIGFDQIVSTKELDKEFIIMQGNGGTAEKAIVIATKPDTKIYVNDETSPIATLAAAGDFYLVPSTKFINGNMRIVVSKNAYVYHKIYGDALSNTNNLMFIPPISCFGEKTVDLIPDARQIGAKGGHGNDLGFETYPNTQLVVLARVPFIPVVQLNGNPIPASVALGTDVTGNIEWKSFKYPIGQDGDVKVTSNGTIQAQLFGGSDNAGFGNYYSGFGVKPVYDIISSDTPDFCAGKSTLILAPQIPGDTYQWYKGDLPIPGATSISYTLDPITDAATAEYHVKITTAAPDFCIVDSEPVKSKLCACSKPGAIGIPDTYTEMGISVRDKRTTANWPKDIPNGFLTMESNSKGFVITRMESPEATILEPKQGMLVYDTNDKCLKLYDGTSWKCIQQTCND